MKITLTYSVLQLHESAAFIWNNNPFVKTWRRNPQSPVDVVGIMMEEMKKTAAHNARVIIGEKNGVNDYEWIDYTGTGGYYFLFTHDPTDDDSIDISVSILVDPNIGKPIKGVLSTPLDIGQEIA